MFGGKNENKNVNKEIDHGYGGFCRTVFKAIKFKSYEFETYSKFITYKKDRSLGSAAKGNLIYSHS